MNKVEYLGLQIENELKKKDDEILKKFEEYLKNNSEKVNIKMNKVSFYDIVNYSGNNTEFFSNCPVYNISDDCFSLLLDCNGKTTISNNFRKKLQKVFIENVSKNIEELSYSNRILDNIELSLFPNLKKVSIKDAGEIISKNELEMFLKRSNIEEFNTDGKFDDDILKDGIFMDVEGDKYGVYKDKKISSGNFFYKEFIDRYNIYSQNPYENIDTIIKVIEDGKNKFEIDENIDIMVYDKIEDIEKKETSSSIIKYNISNKMIKLKNINKVEDAQRVIDSFVNSNYDISEVILELENKTYSDMIKLKHLEKEYNLKIEYNNSLETITADEFITMRATLDYYKSLIEDKNLSPLEKATFGYDIIKSFVYNEVKEDENKSISRNIHSIIESGNIVCVGYARFYAELMKEIGINGYAFGTAVPIDGENFGHARVLLKIDDPKYGIDGTYAFDPTWDSARNFVKVIDKDGNEKIRNMNNLEENDTVVRKYDRLSRYKYFLVPRNEYEEKFVGEKMPKLNEADYYGADEISKSEMKNDSNLDLISFPKEKFEYLVRKIKLCEGYSKESIDELIDEILDINGFNKKEVNEDELESTVKK